MIEIEGFFDYLGKQKNYSVHTLKGYRKDIEQFDLYLKTHLSVLDWSALTHHHVRSWIVSLMRDGYTSKSVNRKISSLKSYFRYLRKKKRIAKNPMSKVVSPKLGKRLPAFVRGKDLQPALLDEVDTGDFAVVRDRVIIEVLYATGVRRSELIQLKEGDIDRHRKQIKVLGKGHKQRILPVTDSLLEIMDEYLRLKHRHFEVSSDHFIVTDKGKKAYPKYLYNRVKLWLSGVTTLKKKSPHVLRHTFATHLANNGADLNAIKELLGHASLAATEVYTHHTVDQLLQVYRQAHPKAK